MTPQEFKTEIFPLGPKLFRFALKMLGKREDSEDMVQETFLKLWSNKDKLGEIQNVDAFAMTITRNLCLDRIKSKAWQIHSALGDEIIEAHGSLSSIIENRDEVRQVSKAISALPELQRMVIHLRDVEGMEFEEIAGVLGTNVNALRVNLSRARKQVRDVLIKTNAYEYSGNRKVT